MRGFSFFVNKDGSHKSTLSLKVFFLGIAFIGVFSLVNVLLIDPLHQMINIVNTPITSFFHCTVIGAVGTLICMLFFLLPDKRLVPMTFVCLAGVLAMVILVALFMTTEVRKDLLTMILLFGAAPVLFGNAASWIIYKCKYCRKESFIR